MLQRTSSITEYHKVLQDTTEYCKALQGRTEQCRSTAGVLQRISECYKVIWATENVGNHRRTQGSMAMELACLILGGWAGGWWGKISSRCEKNRHKPQRKHPMQLLHKKMGAAFEVFKQNEDKLVDRCRRNHIENGRILSWVLIQTRYLKTMMPDHNLFTRYQVLGTRYYKY